jgi:hypothetical protein
MTIDKCRELAVAAQQPFYGVQNGTECWSGSNLAWATRLGSDTSDSHVDYPYDDYSGSNYFIDFPMSIYCDMDCAGASSITVDGIPAIQTCGGELANSLFAVAL